MNKNIIWYESKYLMVSGGKQIIWTPISMKSFFFDRRWIEYVLGSPQMTQKKKPQKNHSVLHQSFRDARCISSFFLENDLLSIKCTFASLLEVSGCPRHVNQWFNQLHLGCAHVGIRMTARYITREENRRGSYILTRRRINFLWNPLEPHIIDIHKARCWIDNNFTYQTSNLVYLVCKTITVK